MISFKSFVNAIHDAILKANEALMDKNTDLLDKYFEEKIVENTDGQGVKRKEEILEPVSVIIDYPTTDDEGNTKSTQIHVPLISLVPIATSQIEKVKLTAGFDMKIVNDDLQIDFSAKKKSREYSKKRKTSEGTLEITISPQNTSEGLNLLIEGYDTLIKRQLP